MRPSAIVDLVNDNRRNVMRIVVIGGSGRVGGARVEATDFDTWFAAQPQGAATALSA